MSDVFSEISSANNGDVALSNDTTNNTSESISISSSNVNLATSSIPVSSPSSILIPSEAALNSSENVTSLDVIPSATATELEGLNNNITSNGTQDDTSVAIVASDSPFILDASQAIELNGEKHEFVQQFQDPESGELLVVLKSESGKHVALPLSTFTDGVDLAPAEVPENEVIPPQANCEATSATSLDGSIVYQAAGDDSCLLNIQQGKIEPTGNDEAFAEDAAKEISAPIATAVLPVASDNGNGATDQPLQSFVPASVSSNDGTESYVIMSSADGSTDQINLTEVIGPSESAGQTYLIETPDGLVACSSTSLEADKTVADTLAPVSPIQSTELSNAVTSNEYVTDSELTTTTEEAILQAVTASGNISDGQIIHAVSGNQTLAYQIAATESGIQLIPMGPVTPEPTSTNNTPAAPSKAANSRTKASNHSNTLLSDQQISTKKGKQSVGRNAKNANATPARLPEYMQHSSTNSKSSSKLTASLFTPTNASSSSLIGDALGPSQLASSHRTYSRKNIVWVSPEATQSTTGTSASSSNSTTIAPSNASSTSTTTKSVTFAPKLNSLVEIACRKNQQSPKSATVTTLSPKKSDIQVVNKRSSPVRGVQVEKEITVTSPSKVVRTPASPRKSPVKSIERNNQNISTASTVTVATAILPASTSITSASPTLPSVVKTSDKNNIAPDTCPKSSEDDLTTEASGSEDKLSDKDNCKPAVEKVVKADDATPQVKRKRGRPPKRTIEQVAVTPTTEAPETSVTTAAVTVTKVETVESGPAKRGKPLTETPKSVEDVSSGRESRRTRRTPKRYASDDENSSEVEKGEKSSLDTTETNKEISIPPTLEHQPSSNCEIGQDSIERPAALEEDIEMTSLPAVEADVVGNDESVSVDESMSVDDTGFGPLTCEITVDSSVGQVDCEGVVDAPTAASPSPKAEKKTKKSVGFKDLNDESAAESESEGSAISTTAPAPRKRVQITEFNGSDDCSPVTKRSPVHSDLKLTPILKTTSKYSPIITKGKRLGSAIVCSFSPTDPATIQSRLRESIASLADTRSAVEKYDLSSLDCSFHIRHQPSSSLYKPGSDSNYICQVCGYTTSRINNLVIHHKELCSVVKKLCRSLWEHEIRKQQTKSNSATSYFPSSPNTESSLSPSSLLAHVSSNNDKDIIPESNEFSDLAV